ncbi:MAG: cytidylate kinase-like family protein [Burkholderiales bacterium]|nr:cytidylate kinase-like family protein [Burkholderiales bacterium]
MGLHAVCISRAIWVGAESIASEVAKELGFRYVDEEIVKLAAEKRNLNAAVVADAERRKNFLEQLVADLKRGGMTELINYIPGQRSLPTSNDDERVLIQDAIRETADQGGVVIVAHAASYALAGRPNVLRVLITGSPMERGKRWLLTSGGKSPREAAETIRDSDLARASYLKRFYNVESETASDYDLTVSTDKMEPEQVKDLILRAARAVEAFKHPTHDQPGWDLPATPRRPGAQQ